MKPLMIDLFCGSFGWSQGWLELGGRVVGFDLEHEPHHGPVPRGADLVLQDVRTIDGAQFKDASLLLCSPPCTEFSYMAMPWQRAKKIAKALRGEDAFPREYTGSRTVAELTSLFDACFRIQREAIAAAGHHIPLVVENVRGAQPWVGRARYQFGSFCLWGDVPALMPITKKAVKVGSNRIEDVGFNVMAVRRMKAEDSVKVGGARGDDWFTHHNRDEFTDRATKNSGGSWFNVAHNTTSGHGRNPDGRLDGVKQPGGGEGYERNHPEAFGWKSSPYSSGNVSARKAAAARIAKIPLPLARHIARVYFPAQQLDRDLLMPNRNASLRGGG